MSAETRKERNNRITNEIMSGTAPTVLRCPSDSSHLDFLPDLFNNFKIGLAVNMLWETDDIAVCLINKVTISEKDAEKYVSCYRNNKKLYRNVLLSKVCSLLLEEKNDCLLFLCGLEKVAEREKETLEYLIESTPSNVKLVLCSEQFLELDYSFSEHRFPRLIPGEVTERDLPYDRDLSETLTTEQKELLAKICPFEFVWGKYIETVYPEARELVRTVRNRFRFAFLQTGDVYRFHPEFIRQFAPENNLQAQENYLRFCLSHGKVFYFDRAFLLRNNDLVYDMLHTWLREGKTEQAFESVKKYSSLSNEEDFSFSAYPFSKIKYYTALQKSKTALEPTEEWRRCPPNEFVGWGDILARLHHQQKVALGNMNFFPRKCLQIIQSGEERNHPLYLEWLIQVADIFTLTGKYMPACTALREIVECYPLFRLNVGQSIALFLGMSCTDFEKEWKEWAQKEERAVLPFLHGLFTGENKGAELRLSDFISGISDPFQLAYKVSLYALFRVGTGKTDYARSLALLYIEKCKIVAPGSVLPLYSVLAVCAWQEGNKSLATGYASQNRLDRGKNVFSFLSEGILVSRLVEEEKSQENIKLAEYILKTAQDSLYDNVIVAFQRCFVSVLQLAEENGILPDYLPLLLKAVKMKKKEESEGSLQVRFFGNSAVYVDKQEIRWKTRKCKELFLLYQLFPEGLDRNWILENVWNGYVYNSAINNLKTSNNLIRNVLTQHGVPFEFTYFNGKYRLLSKHTESDFDMYKQFIKTNSATDVKKKTIELNRIYGLCEEGFVADSDLPFFVQTRKEIREEIALRIVTLIKHFMVAKDYIGAKRMVGRLEKLQYPDWEKLKTEIDKKVLES